MENSNKGRTMAEAEKAQDVWLNIFFTLLILGSFLATFVIDTNISDALPTANTFQKIVGVVMYVAAIAVVWKFSNVYSMGRFTVAGISILLAGLAPLVVACHTL